MKGLFVCLFIWMSVPIFPEGDELSNDLLLWDKRIRLTWGDFKGRVNDSIKTVQYGLKPKAVSFIGYTFEEYELENKLYWRIETYFDRATSFSLSKEDSFLLQHEQCHFDIFELYARKMRKSLMTFETSKRSGFNDSQ